MARLETDLRNEQAKLKRQGDTHPAAMARLIDPKAVTTHLPCFSFPILIHILGITAIGNFLCMGHFLGFMDIV